MRRCFRNGPQADAGWIGFFSTTAGCLMGIALGAVSDKFAGRMKAWIVVMYAGGFLCFGWFTLMCCGGGASADSGGSAGLGATGGGLCSYVDYSLTRVYIAIIGGGLCLNGTIPLFYELCMETTYPIKEGSTAGFLVLIPNFLQSVFLSVPLAHFGTQWMNWTLTAALPLCIRPGLPGMVKRPQRFP